MSGTFLLFPAVCLSGTKLDDFQFFFPDQEGPKVAAAQLPPVNAHSVMKSQIGYFTLAHADQWFILTSPFRLYSHCSKRLLIWLAEKSRTPRLSQPSLSVSTESRVTVEILGDLFLAAVVSWRALGGRLAPINKTLACKRSVQLRAKRIRFYWQVLLEQV